MRMTMGITHPAGKSRTFSDHGRRYCEWLDSKSGERRALADGTHMDDFMMVNSKEDAYDEDNDADDPPDQILWGKEQPSPVHGLVVCRPDTQRSTEPSCRHPDLRVILHG